MLVVELIGLALWRWSSTDYGRFVGAMMTVMATALSLVQVGRWLCRFTRRPPVRASSNQRAAGRTRMGRVTRPRRRRRSFSERILTGAAL